MYIELVFSVIYIGLRSKSALVSHGQTFLLSLGWNTRPKQMKNVWPHETDSFWNHIASYMILSFLNFMHWFVISKVTFGFKIDFCVFYMSCGSVTVKVKKFCYVFVHVYSSMQAYIYYLQKCHSLMYIGGILYA